MSDGSRLKLSWYSALSDAETHFRQLLVSSSTEWKRLPHPGEASSSKQKAKIRPLAIPEVTDVVVHRKSNNVGEDVYRMVLEVPVTDEQMSLEPWKAVLTTPELRQEWDPAVEDAHLLEMFDRNTRISKTNYMLGWPANPRDSITISRAFYDDTTLIDITTSLPRSSDEPAYLRPSPPFVRSHVQLFAWCIQHIQPQPTSPADSKKLTSSCRLRVTCFWQHDLKALWGFGTSTTSLIQQLSTMTLSLLKIVIKRGNRVPKLAGYGNCVSIERVRYQLDREALSIDYSIIPDDEDHSLHHEIGLQGMDEVHALREHRRLTRSIECILPSSSGWDVQVAMKGSSEEVESLPWSAHAIRNHSNSPVNSYDQVVLRITHGALLDDDSVLKVKVVIEVAGGTRGLRLNGLATKIQDVEERDPSARMIPQKILQDVASAVDLSVQTSSSMGTVSSNGSSVLGMPPIRPTERTAAAEKSILSKVKRNYIYFSSLLQEPEAKWKRTTEARGVSVTQLDSIDPTLVVYRAEATFVGVGLWDLYAAVVSPGARVYWDKQHEDGVLLEDVNELTELWHFKTKPAWPVNGRDAVILKTVYKSSATIHVFSFSADDPHLFPHIPPAEPNVIRTQVDLQGWAIEALSPTTTLLTLLEQSDPKGWTNKTSIPTQMINTLAGIGEFAIKCGGPPVVTRLAGSKANELRYDHERGLFKIDYEPSASRRSTSTNTVGTNDTLNSATCSVDNTHPAVECEIRCDVDTWAASLDIVVDPPPQTITCLRRHRLSAEGGGLWLTLTHDSVFLEDERLLAVVRRAPGKEKGLVMVNGAEVQVDYEELPDHEIKTLSKQRRIKPTRIPLDQPPVIGVVRRRKAEWTSSDEGDSQSSSPTTKSDVTVSNSAPRISSPLARFFTYAVDQATMTTQQAVAAISPANSSGSISSTLDPTKLPMQYALEALVWTQRLHSKPQDGWTLVGDKGIVVERKLIPSISPFIPIHKGFKVIQGVSAEEIASVIMSLDCRKTWDERFDFSQVLQCYGGQTKTAFMVLKAGFPFRDRGFYLASVMAREYTPLAAFTRRPGEVSENSPTARNAIFCVSASFSVESAKDFSPEKYNSYGLPIGRVYLDAWILETLDPYTKENYTIPSSRCTRLVAVDYAGSIPAAFNSAINTSLARGVLAVETYMKNTIKATMPMTRLPTPGLLISEGRLEDDAASAVSVSGKVDTGSAGVIISAPFMAWKLRRKDHSRVLLDNRFDAEKKVYSTSVLISVTSQPGSNSKNEEFVAPSSSSDEISSSSTTITVPVNESTPRLKHLSLSRSPHRDDMTESQTSDSTLASDSTILGKPDKRIALSIAPATPALAIPGAMVSTPLPNSTSFPSSQSPSNNFSLSTPMPITRQASSSASISPPRLRQRALSSGSSAFSVHSVGIGTPTTLYHPDGSVMRGRTTSTAFTVKGEIKLITDLTVMEVVIDSKLFAIDSDNAGNTKGYTVDVRAYARAQLALHRHGLDAVSLSRLGKGIGAAQTASTFSTSKIGSTGLALPATSDTDDSFNPPFIYSLYTMPSSPLHSSGLSAENPSRHLLRLTLPTAQYQVNNIKDPLTGKTRTAPSKPAWLRIFEEGAIVELTVRPIRECTKGVVSINGKEVHILGERESLTTLGREELLDDRTARMGILSRMPNDAEPLPLDLREPVAVADDLLLSDSISEGTKAGQVGSSQRIKPENTDETSSASEPHNVAEEFSKMAKNEVAAAGGPHVEHAASSGPGGLLGFFQGYPNPLTRFTGGASMIVRSTSRASTCTESAGTAETDPGEAMQGARRVIIADAGDGTATGDEVTTASARQRGGGPYPLATVLFVGLIAFLLGSLLRSLLSPADFIYVVTDLGDAEEGVSGWREIRRLVEIKYLWGGWDLQVAVVRRQ